jgi:hypothetical protein
MVYALFFATLKNRVLKNLLGRACFKFKKSLVFQVENTLAPKIPFWAIFERSEKEPVNYNVLITNSHQVYYPLSIIHYTLPTCDIRP